MKTCHFCVVYGRLSPFKMTKVTGWKKTSGFSYMYFTCLKSFKFWVDMLSNGPAHKFSKRKQIFNADLQWNLYIANPE